MSFNSIQFKWPSNSKQIGLSGLEKMNIQAIINYKIQTLVNNPRLTYINFEKNTKISINNVEILIPRRIILFRDKAIVCLNRNKVKGIEGGSEQSLMKLGYDPINGQKIFKKNIFDVKQYEFLEYVSNQLSESKKEGLAKIYLVEIRKGKMQYYEQIYVNSIAQIYRNQSIHQINLLGLIYLQTSIAAIHSTSYRASSFNSMEETLTSTFSCWHGDISPNNIVLEQTQYGYNYKLIDWGSSMILSKKMYTRGWNSPELTSVNNPNFNQLYGTKKDAWALGLIIGSILLGGFTYIQNYTLPKFNFILNKLKFNGAKLDCSGIALITQNEIDLEIEAIIQNEEPIRKVFWEVIKKWLIVDPNLRKNVAECHLNLSFENINS